VEFSSQCCFYKLSHSWLLGLWCGSCLLQPSLFIYSSLRDFPFPPLWCSGCPTLFATCLFFLLLLIIQFFFFPWVGVGLSRGLC
jgi:hypothetical protein